MKVYQAIGRKLLNTTRITDVVGREIHHGDQPRRAKKYINYFLVPGMPLLANGVVLSQSWQVSCRAEDPEDAYDLAQAVSETLHNLEEHVSISAGTDGIVDGGAADTSTYGSEVDAGSSGTTFYYIMEAGDDIFSVDRINVTNMSLMKDPDAEYWHVPIDINIINYSNEDD